MIQKQEPLTLAETKKLLEKADAENLRAKKTMDYIKKFSKKKPEKVREIVKKLNEAEISKLKNHHIVKIADILPESAAELRSIFFGGEVNLDSNETEKILQIIKDNK